MSDPLDSLPMPPPPAADGGRVPEVNRASARLARNNYDGVEFYFHPQGATVLITSGNTPVKMLANGRNTVCTYTTADLRNGRGRWAGPVRIEEHEII